MCDNKDKAWELYELCKEYLEENEKHWQQKKKERMAEERKIERLTEVRVKKEQLKEKLLTRNLEQKLSQLPESDKKKMIEKRERRGWRYRK